MTKRLYDYSMCFGAFDLFHPGHEFFLRECAKMGEKLVVVVARDANVERIKGEKPWYKEEERQRTIEEAFPTATVTLGDISDFYAPIKKYKPDVLCFGYDQKAREDEIKKLFPGIKIVRISPYKEKEFKSSILKAK